MAENPIKGGNPANETAENIISNLVITDIFEDAIWFIFLKEFFSSTMIIDAVITL